MHILRSTWLAVVGASLLILQTGQDAAGAVAVDALERQSVASNRLSTALMLSVAQADKRLVAVGERGLIQFSDDNGVTWTQASSPVSVTLTSVRFINASKGWSVGHGGIVLATSDGGKTGRKQLVGVWAAALMKAAAMSEEGGGRAAALREAEQLVQEGPDKPFFDVYFSDENSGLIVGAYGLAFFTEDGGSNWKPMGSRIANPTGSHLFKIYAGTSGLWIVGERGLVMRGHSILEKFSTEKLPYNGSLYGASCLPERGCYVYGLRGNLLRLDLDSHSWDVVENDQPATITTSIVDPGKSKGLIFADQSGRILRLDQPTSRLTPMTTQSLPPINALSVAGDGGVVAATVNGMIRIAPSVFK